MATYLMTFTFTDQGIRNVKNVTERVRAAKKTVHAFGGEVRAFYGIVGADYDTMFILEAPDDEAVAKMALSISSLGNVRTTTHRAFGEDEFNGIVASLHETR